jgi:futalosine hydrolase
VSGVVVCVSTALEGEGFPRSIGGTAITVVRTGVGPVNAAFALTRRLGESHPRAVIACGVGGAYAASGLAIGDVVSADSETYGDLGATSPEGFLDMQALGFPVVDRQPPLFNRLPLDLFPTARRVPFVTCSTCTGTDEDARAIVARTGGAVESMEGAAIVHVARLSHVPVGEIRGISNIAGRRDRATWRLQDAAAAARRTLIAWIEAGGC